MTQIIKSGQVSMEGPVKLKSTASAPLPVQTQRHHANTSDTAILPTATIVETTELYALVEVVCSCGQKNLIKCEF